MAEADGHQGEARMSTNRRRRSNPTKQLFLPIVGRTDAGSIRVEFRPAPPLRSLYEHERALSELIYRIAAELERQSERLGVGWAIAPQTFRARIDVELGDHDDPELAAELVAAVLSDFGLA
jgi:hypothetical protein